jgi:hypothetical protein
MCVIDATSRMLGGFCAAFQKLRANPAGVTVSATHSTAQSDAAGHHHAGSPVRLQGGQRARVVSHDAIMTDCVTNGQIARMPPLFRDRMLQIAQRGREHVPGLEYASAGRNMLPNPANLLRSAASSAYYHCRSASAKRFDEPQTME